MIIHYMAEKNIFVVIAYMLSLQKKFLRVILKIALKLLAKQTIKMPKRGEYVKYVKF